MKENRNPPGFQIWQDKKPPFRWRARHRKSGETINTSKFPLYSMSFYAEADRITKANQVAEAKPGTLGMLIFRYRASDAFQADIKPRTRSDYQKCADYLKAIESTPLSRFSAPLVIKIRDKAVKSLGYKWGNYVRTFLSALFTWGKDRGYIKDNPAFGIRSTKRPKDMPAANRPWQDNEREAVLAVLPAHMKLPFALMMYCGLDPNDARSLPRNAISGGKIDTRRGKTGVAVFIPAPAPLLEAIRSAPQHDAITLCANSYGVPWTYNGFSTNWHRINKTLKEDGIVQPGLTLKGLRHTVATILAELGFDERTIADMLGQSTIDMARHYSKRADKSRKMIGVVADFDKELNRRKTENVKPS